jgi:Fanconi anemia group M protein
MFHNIFDNKKEKQSNKTKIIIDNREKQSLVPSELFKLNFNIQFQQLAIADYILNDIVIERKTISDLKSSIINRRIFKQITELKRYKKYLLIIEGNQDELFNNKIIHKNAIKGFIQASQLDFQIPIIFSENEKDTALNIFLLSKRDPNKKISLINKQSSTSINQQKLNILQSFPNIGPATAEKLLKEFKSLNNIFNSSESELEKIIGKKSSIFYQLVRR